MKSRGPKRKASRRPHRKPARRLPDRAHLHGAAEEFVAYFAGLRR